MGLGKGGKDNVRKLSGNTGSQKHIDAPVEKEVFHVKPNAVVDALSLT